MDDSIQDKNIRISELKAKIDGHNQEMTDLLKYFDLIIVDTKDDLRIVNCFGPIEDLFKSAEKMFERGFNLIKAIYKITKNTKARPEEIEDEVQESNNELSLEELLNRFVSSTREEKEFQIIGETETGDIFLLIWKIRRLERYFRSYLKVVPTNSIIKNMQKKHNEEIEQLKNDAKLVYENIHDGITMLDLKNKIQYMNESAKKLYFNTQNKLTKNANFEGRLFQEIFVNEDVDVVKDIMGYNKRILFDREPISYTKKIAEHEVSFHLKPIFNERSFIIGLLIISRETASDFNIDTNKLFNALKNLSIENKNLFSKVKDLEIQIMKSNEKISDYQNTIKLFYSFLERIPSPLSIIKLSSMQYEFINSAFESKINIRKEFIRGKRDEEIFPDNISIILRNSIPRTIDTKQAITIIDDEINLKQCAIYNPNNEPTHIIRLYE
jgi:hypothetical protein